MRVQNWRRFTIVIITIMMLLSGCGYLIGSHTTDEVKTQYQTLVIGQSEPLEVDKVINTIEPQKGLIFEITAYCSCEICTGNFSDGITATGTKVKEGRTIAVDPDVIPLGSKVVIEGFDRVFIAEDTGNPKYMSGRRIDIYMDSHDKALNFGRKERRVWVLK